MKKILPIFAFLFLFTTLLSAQDKVEYSFDYDGLTRDYFVILPNGYTPGTPVPVVFNFHGITSSNEEQYGYTGLFGGFNEVADTGQFIVCYPNGTKIPNDTGFEWNVGFSFSTSTADDVGFVDALIDTLYADYNIDLNRLYATGMSNGGYFAYRLACELPERFQAIASVTGSIVPEEFAKCYPGTTIPVMQIHNTGDQVVPYNGFQHGTPIEEVIARWRQFDFCSPVADTFAFPNIDLLDGSTVEKYSWTDCYANRQVVLYKVNGGDHTWPGSKLVLAATNNDILASREIWEFFLQFNQPIAVSTQKPLQVLEELTFSPNPFQESLYIQSNGSQISAIQVFTTTGQLVHQSNRISSQNHQLSLENLNKGMYLVQVKTAKGSQTHKVIKE